MAAREPVAVTDELRTPSSGRRGLLQTCYRVSRPSEPPSDGQPSEPGTHNDRGGACARLRGRLDVPPIAHSRTDPRHAVALGGQAASEVPGRLGLWRSLSLARILVKKNGHPLELRFYRCRDVTGANPPLIPHSHTDPRHAVPWDLELELEPFQRKNGQIQWSN